VATSGSIALVYTRDDIIQEALELSQAIEMGGTPEAAHVTSVARTLNLMVKAWQTEGLQIHTVQRSYLFAGSATQREYRLNATGDRWVKTYVGTALKVAGVATDLTIDVDSITGISNLGAIGIYLDDGTLHWTTVNGVPAGDTVTIAAALPSAAAIGNTVYFYALGSNLADRPMEITNVWERNSEGNDRPLDLISRTEYAELTLKENSGGVVSVFYDPQVATPTMFIWPVHEDPRMIIGAWVKRTVENFDAAGDDADFPQEAFMALSINLAHLISTKVGTAPATQQMLAVQAGIWYQNYMDYACRAEEAVTFEPFGDLGWGDEL